MTGALKSCFVLFGTLHLSNIPPSFRLSVLLVNYNCPIENSEKIPEYFQIFFVTFVRGILCILLIMQFSIESRDICYQIWIKRIIQRWPEWTNMGEKIRAPTCFQKRISRYEETPSLRRPNPYHISHMYQPPFYVSRKSKYNNFYSMTIFRTSTAAGYIIESSIS